MRYRAFLSYSRHDDRVAAWLHRRLDAYRTPATLAGAQGAWGEIPKSLFPIYRDRTDASGGGHLALKIEDALRESECLIVLCSPAAVRSPWVNREINTFLETRDEERIFPVIASGLPEASDVEEAFYPQALRGRGILATDLREIRLPSGQIVGDGREGGRLKLLSGLLGVTLDQLINRDRARQRRLVWALGAAAVLFAIVSAGAVAGFVMAAQNAERARANEIEAREQRSIAIANAERANARAEGERRERGRADAEAAKATANAREAERQRQVATSKAIESRGRLLQTLATRAKDDAEKGKHIIAARYALAGLSLLPENAPASRNVLAGIMQQSMETLPSLIHENGVESVEFSSDGRRVLTASRDRTAKIWDAKTGRLIRVLGSHGGWILSASWSPDQSSIVTASSDGTAIIWNADSGQREQILRGHLADVEMAEFSPDGRRVLTASEDGAVKIWERSSGRLLTTFSGHRTRARKAHFSPDGELVASISYRDLSARVWRVSNGEPVATLEHKNVVADLSFNRDGKKLLTASADGTVKIWSVPDGTLLQTLTGSTGFIAAASFSPDETRVATGSTNGSVKLFDVATGAITQSIPAHGDEISHLAFNPDGKLLLTASEDMTARIWSTSSGEPVEALNGHTGEIWDARFSPDGRSVVTASGDGTARIWFIQSRREMSELTGPSPSQPVAAFYSPDGSQIFLLSRTFDKSVQVWDARTLGLLESRDVDGIWFLSGALTRDGARLVGSSSTDALTIWDTGSGRVVAETPKQGNFARALAWSWDGRRVITTDSDDFAKVWAGDSGKLLATLRSPSGVVDGAFSSDGRLIATGSLDDVARIWDSSGVLIRELRGHSGSLTDVEFSADGRRVLTASEDKTINIWDARNGALVKSLVGHGGTVTRAHFSTDGLWVISASADRTARVWDIATGQAVATLAGHQDGLVDANFSPDAKRVVTLSQDSSSRVWDVARATQPVAELVRQTCQLFLGASQRQFSRAEIEADPVLAAEWREPNRDVCSRVKGLPTINALRLASHVTPDLAFPFKDSELRQAVDDVSAEIKRDSSAADLYVMRGELFNLLRKTRDALADFDRAAQLSPQAAEIENSRCWYRAVANIELETAMTACQKAIALMPLAADFYDSRGLVYLRTGNPNAAWRDYDRAVGLRPGIGQYLYGRGIAAMRLARTADGRADIVAALKLDPAVDKVYQKMGIRP